MIKLNMDFYSRFLLSLMSGCRGAIAVMVASIIYALAFILWGIVGLVLAALILPGLSEATKEYEKGKLAWNLLFKRSPSASQSTSSTT